MKRLLLLRHAKSSWKDLTLADHDRPLKKRGKVAAPRMGALAREQGVVPELVLCSTASRARATAAMFAEEAGYAGEMKFDRELYLAEPSRILDFVAACTPDTVSSVMVVGHNPGLEELVEQLTGEIELFPTAAFAEIHLPITSWKEVCSARGALVNLWRPRELD